MLIAGGSDGIMVCAAGDGRTHSFALSIRLPSEQRVKRTRRGRSQARDAELLFTRKLSFVKEAHAFALLPGGFGTMDEVFEGAHANANRKARIVPIVLLDRSRGKYWDVEQFLTERLLKFGFISEEDFAFFKIKHSAQDAAGKITQFYKVFHSAGWCGERFVIRLIVRYQTKRSEQSLHGHPAHGQDCPARCISERKR